MDNKKVLDAIGMILDVLGEICRGKFKRNTDGLNKIAEICNALIDEIKTKEDKKLKP